MLIVVLSVLGVALLSAAVLLIKYGINGAKIRNTEPRHRIGAFYYNLLSYREQLLYDEIYEAAAVLEANTGFVAQRFTPDEFDGVVRCLIADNPRLFYVNYGSFSLEQGFFKARVNIEYGSSRDVIIEMKRSLTAKLSVMSFTGDSEYEKVLAVHDYLIRSCELASDGSSLSHTAYGAFIDGFAYADGYAYALKLLLDEMNIYSFPVYGEAGGAPHVWSMFYADEKFYHVDVLWDDAGYDFSDNLLFHGYFGLSDALIFLDHKPERQELLPQASAEYDYYTAKSLYCSDINELEAVAYSELTKAVSQRKDYIELAAPNGEFPDEWKTAFKSILEKINSEHPEAELNCVFRVFRASDTGNGLTIQLFYKERINEQ